MASSSAARPCIRHALRTCRQPNFAPLSPRFSAPLLQQPQASAFSTSSPLCKRQNRDNNRSRGLSPMRKTGTRQVLSVSNEELPQPRAVADFPKIKVDPDHGLWGFFYSKETPIQTPEEDVAHGRAWTVQELRQKSWDDLHKLWWMCVKERNRIHTAHKERDSGSYGYGAAEGGTRDEVVCETMRAIKHTLTERYYVWEDARELAKYDPEIQFDHDQGRVEFSPNRYEDDNTALFEDEAEEDITTEGEAAEEEATDTISWDSTETDAARKGDATSEEDKQLFLETPDPSTMLGPEKPTQDAPRV